MLLVNPGAPRRSTLCVPAGDPNKLLKALASGADEVVIDLEDAVSLDSKDRARAALREFDWRSVREGPTLAVRVNAPGSPWCHRDLEAVAAIDACVSVVVPKVESRADVGFVERLLDGLEAERARQEPLGVQALVETATGVLALGEIVRDVRRLTSVIIGYADLAASLGRSRPVAPQSWAGIRDAVLLHTRSAGLAAVDGPFLGVADDEAFREDVAGAAAAGFDAKWVIHPRQVEAVNRSFTPTDDAIAHAQRVLSALALAAEEGKGAGVIDGALVDEAMARDARRILARVVA